MTAFVKSLKRLYTNGKVTEEKLKEMLVNEKISKGEYSFIVEEPTEVE